MRPSKKKNSSSFRFPAGALRLSLGLAASAAAYMLFESQWLSPRKKRLVLEGLPQPLDGLRLLHVSDLHAGAPGLNDTAIHRFVAAVPGLKPDLILFTGDMVDKKKDLSPYIDLLSKLEAPLGKLAVLGNHDHGLTKTVIQDIFNRLTGRSRFQKMVIPPSETQMTVSRNRRLFERAGIQLLENECTVIESNGVRIQVCGVDELQYGLADLDRVLAEIDPLAPLRILLSHAPEAFLLVGQGDFQLLLAGHTHGGQICLPHPTRGKLPLSYSGSDFADGFHFFPGTTMHVSRGVGTTLVPFRLLSRPEVTLLELVCAGE